MSETCDSLKNCPFCGTAPTLPPTDKLVCCTNHLCSIYGRHMSVKTWNTRFIEGNVLSENWVEETPTTDFNESLQREAYESQREAGYPGFVCDFDFARKLELELRRWQQTRIDYALTISRHAKEIKRLKNLL